MFYYRTEAIIIEDNHVLMRTNFYFRKKTVDAPRLYSIVDKLNAEIKAVIAKYNGLMQSARLEMGIESVPLYAVFCVTPQ